MDEYEMILKRHKERMKLKEKKATNFISKTFSKILLSIIFILGSCIYIHLNDSNKNVYKDTIFESNLTFAKMNHWYESMFGSILPSVPIENQVVAKEDITLGQMETYLDGYKLHTSSNQAISAIGSGILVYLDEKDGYGKTAIIQGVDGVDIWYGNLTDFNLKLYDYVEEGTIIGNSSGDYYLVFYKDGKPISYESYGTPVEN